MKRRLSLLILVVFAVSIFFPIKALAIGGYFVIKGEKIYHSATCEKIRNQNIENMRWYESLDKLKWSGCEPCPNCKTSRYNYDRDGDTFLNSKSNEKQNWLEIERFFGITDGYNSGFKEGTEKGYNKGYKEGLESADKTILNEAKEERQQSLAYILVAIFLIILMFVGGFIEYLSLEKKEKRVQALKDQGEQVIANKTREFNEWADVEKNKILQQYDKINLVIKSTKQNNPELARQISDVQYYFDMDTHRQMVNKPRPAIRAAEEVKKIASEKRSLLKENRQLQYQLDFYEKLFPWLEEFKEVPSDEAVSYATGSYGSEYDAVRKWISPEDFEKLSNAEKYQKILDRWKARKKTDWDVGIEYERYIGYKLECDGYKVSYIGAMFGLKDMGRDLIATKSGKTLVIQCKRWSKEKTIHEKHLFQLYGSTAVYAIEHPSVQCKAVFITTTELSETARKCAEYCDISVVENCPMGDYPLIKCNANKDGEKIYHLPFDQQYDKIVISKNKQSSYAWTTHEAEQKGFRRAYRWNPNKS